MDENRKALIESRFRDERLSLILGALPRKPGVVSLERASNGVRLEVIQVLYERINVELIVIADEAEAVETELEAALDRLEEKHTLFGGGIETVAFEHMGIQKKSALAHTMAAAGTAAAAVRNAGAWLLHCAQSSDVGRRNQQRLRNWLAFEYHSVSNAIS